jgi:hypothetical protein
MRIGTWDAGERVLDAAAATGLLVPVLETILEGGLWKQFRRFPPDTLARLLPHLTLSPSTRRLIELWIETAPQRDAQQVSG